MSIIFNCPNFRTCPQQLSKPSNRFFKNAGRTTKNVWQGNKGTKNTPSIYVSQKTQKRSRTFIWGYLRWWKLISITLSIVSLWVTIAITRSWAQLLLLPKTFQAKATKTMECTILQWTWLKWGRIQTTIKICPNPTRISHTITHRLKWRKALAARTERILFLKMQPRRKKFRKKGSMERKKWQINFILQKIV